MQEGVYDEFVKSFTKAVSSLKVGNGLEAGISQGPLIDDRAIKTVQSMVDDAVAKGGKLLLGGKVHAKGGTFFDATAYFSLFEFRI